MDATGKLAARVGLYHFGIVSAIWILDAVAHRYQCTGSPLSNALVLLELPGIAVVYSGYRLLGSPSNEVASAMVTILVSCAASSGLYAGILYFVGRTVRSIGRGAGHRGETEQHRG